MPVVPNFFVAGAPKAGTTSLCNYLRQHPQVFMSPVKEPNYFALEMRPENFEPSSRAAIQRRVDELHRRLQSDSVGSLPSGITVDWEDYLRLFRGVTNEQAIGEGSVSYLWSTSAPARICEALGDVRVIVSLRDPADRAFSQYLQDLGNGHVRCSFTKHLDAALRRRGDTIGVLHPFLEYGLYFEQLSRWLETFPAHCIHIVWYEELADQPLETLNAAYEFLGLPAFRPDVSRRFYEAQVPVATGASALAKQTGLWRAIRHVAPAPVVSFMRRHAYRPRGTLQMTAEDRARLIDYYRQDTEQLASMTNRDLTAWLT
jgi:hypothetical protein